MFAQNHKHVTPHPCNIVPLRTMGIALLNKICPLLVDLPYLLLRMNVLFECHHRASQDKYFKLLTSNKGDYNCFSRSFYLFLTIWQVLLPFLIIQCFNEWLRSKKTTKHRQYMKLKLKKNTSRKKSWRIKEYWIKLLSIWIKSAIISHKR